MSEIRNESSSLRYMTNDGIAEGDAAQNFLQNKLKEGAAGRYTKEQYEELGRNGGLAVVNASDGAIPAGQYYDSQNPTKNQGDGVAAGDWSNTEFTSDWAKEKYTSGHWGSGELSAEELASKYGLDTSEEARKRAEGRSDDHDIWGTNSDGTRVFIGNTEGNLESLMGNSALIGGHSVQAHGEEADHTGDVLSSEGDVKGALLNQWKAGGGKEIKKVEEEENKPIEHSPEIKQAVQRVRTYENDVMSGKISNDIFGGAKSYGDYSFDSSGGASSIGKLGSDNSAAKATSSFLNNKKAEVQKKYNFQAAG